jgi:hypothetical protein
MGFHQYNRPAGNRKEVFDYRQERMEDVNNSFWKSSVGVVEAAAAWRQEWINETHAPTGTICSSVYYMGPFPCRSDAAGIFCRSDGWRHFKMSIWSRRI